MNSASEVAKLYKTCNIVHIKYYMYTSLLNCAEKQGVELLLHKYLDLGV